MKRMINYDELMTLNVIRSVIKQSEVYNVSSKERLTQEREVIKGLEQEKEYYKESKKAA